MYMPGADASQAREHGSSTDKVVKSGHERSRLFTEFHGLSMEFHGLFTGDGGKVQACDYLKYYEYYQIVMVS